MKWTIQEITNRCVETCGKVGIEFNIPVKINGRLTKTLGRLCYKKEYPLIPDRIEISKSLLDTSSDKSIIGVIDHECCHYIVAVETKERHGHDAYFKDACRRVGCSNNMALTEVERVVPQNKIYKYQVICDKCGYTLGYARAGNVVKYVDYYACGNCGGSLRVQQNW